MKRLLVSLLFVIAAVLILMIAIVFTASPAGAIPQCACLDASATRNTPGGITYTVIITGSGSSWYDVAKSPGGQVVAGPSQSRVFDSVTLQPSTVYKARVSDSRNGTYYTSTACTITLSPTAVTFESITAEPSVQPLVGIGIFLMLLCLSLPGAWAARMGRRR